MNVTTAAERPDLVEVAWERTSDTLPEYNNHGDVLNRYWPRLDGERPEFQFFLVDDDGEVLVRGHSIPVRWDSTPAGLPAGIDGAIANGFEEDGANALCALLIAVAREAQGRGLSAVAVRAMRELGGRHGLGELIAPVRP